MQYLPYYLLLINAIGFLLMRADKLRARRKKWRIPEAALMFTAMIGGSLGSTLAMVIFRHKTKHSLFSIGLPVLLLLHLGCFLFYFT